MEAGSRFDLQALRDMVDASSNTTPLFLCCTAQEEVPDCIAAIQHLAAQLEADCLVLDLVCDTPEAVVDRLLAESHYGEWVVLLNSQVAKQETLRRIGVSIYTRTAADISFPFRLWLPHLGDINPSDYPEYPSSLLVSALFLTTAGLVASKASFTADQVVASVVEKAASDVCALEERLYSNDPAMHHVTLMQRHLPHLFELMEAVKFCRTCRSLAFHDCSLTALEVAYIANVLKSSCRLHRLALSRCCLSDDGVLELCQGLRRNTTLCSLDLSRNPSIGNAGVHLLAELLHPDSGCGLQQLVFRYNNSLRHHHALGFHHSSVLALCRSLRANTHLTALDVHSTKLTSRSIQSLARTLRHNHTLLSLDLSDNRVGDEAGVAIADALCSKNRTLTHLDISSSGISAITLCAFAQAIKHNHVLRVLVMNDNRVVQLPEPQHLSNAVFDDHDDIVADPDQAEAPSSSDEEDPNQEGPLVGDPHDTSFGEYDEEEGQNDATGSPAAGTQALGSTIAGSPTELPLYITEELASNALETISKRYHRLEGMEAMAAALQTNSSLTDWQLNNCCLCEAALKSLVDALLIGNNTTLIKLGLAHNEAFEERASMLLKDLITDGGHITDLNLGGNNSIVAERAILALERTTILRRLDISRCCLAEEVVASVYDITQRSPQCPLRALSLEGNQINPAALRMLGRALVLPHLVLRELNLGSTMDLSRWPDGGCTAMESFGKSVADAAYLKELYFFNNGVTDAAAQCFASVACESSSLEKLDFSRNPITSTTQAFRALPEGVIVLTGTTPNATGATGVTLGRL
eukprot:GGOE01036617.1.p1 GENE.GGOE01036617.1~~GGOE01036617.1.p1  ORF type:complete len:808 (-),score=274.35 GGOE01036617.1:278-2701(-)